MPLKRISRTATTEKAVEIIAKQFETDILEPIRDLFEKTLGDWYLKSAFYDSLRGGKRLRPLLMLVFHRMAGGQKIENLTKFAASIELLHCASLVMDDLFDNSAIRKDRNENTIRRDYSAEEAMTVASLSGVYALNLLCDGTVGMNEKDCKIRGYFLEGLTSVARGELDKLDLANNRRIVSKRIYWDKMINSTGIRFFKLAADISVCSATEDEETRLKLSKIALRIGSLLQGCDDLKDLNEDIERGLYTLAVINYYTSLNLAEKAIFKKKIKEINRTSQANHMYEKIMNSPAIEETIKELQILKNKIIGELSKLPDSIEKDALIGMCEFLVNEAEMSVKF